MRHAHGTSTRLAWLGYKVHGVSTIENPREHKQWRCNCMCFPKGIDAILFPEGFKTDEGAHGTKRSCTKHIDLHKIPWTTTRALHKWQPNIIECALNPPKYAS